MAIGRTFSESLQKALRSLEQGRAGPQRRPGRGRARRAADRRAAGADRRGHARARLRARGGAAPRRAASTRSVARTGIDPWFVRQLARIVGRAAADRGGAARSDRADFRRAKRLGFSDAQLAYLRGTTRGRHPGGPAVARRAGDLQDGRHLRGRVRGVHAVPLRHLRGGGRGPPVRARPRHHPRARAPTASARGSSSTTAACTRPWRCATPATRRSWSTATPRPSRPTTTPRTASTSSR